LQCSDHDIQIDVPPTPEVAEQQPDPPWQVPNALPSVSTEHQPAGDQIPVAQGPSVRPHVRVVGEVQQNKGYIARARGVVMYLHTNQTLQ
jgi:hypothetical protein